MSYVDPARAVLCGQGVNRACDPVGAAPLVSDPRNRVFLDLPIVVHLTGHVTPARSCQPLGQYLAKNALAGMFG